jgi:hypothetical protein
MILAGLLLLSFFLIDLSTSKTGNLHQESLGLGVAGGFMILLSSCFLAFGVGALNLRRWAWKLGVTMHALGLVMSIAQIKASDGRSFIGMLLELFILAYLFSPNVMQAFGLGEPKKSDTEISVTSESK